MQSEEIYPTQTETHEENLLQLQWNLLRTDRGGSLGPVMANIILTEFERIEIARSTYKAASMDAWIILYVAKSDWKSTGK
jgi:hypothetical protein